MRNSPSHSEFNQTDKIKTLQNAYRSTYGKDSTCLELIGTGVDLTQHFSV